MVPPKPYHLLVVEDDVDVLHALSSYLEFEGYETTASVDGEDAVRVLQRNTGFDLVLLDVMLPKLDGFGVLREIRSMGMQTPVVMLTVRDDEADVLKGFSLGADDYVPKPFSAELLRCRIRAILSRTKPPSDQPMIVHSVGDVKVNFTSSEAFRNGEPIEFTALEMELLRYLITHRGRTLSRTQLLQDVWKLPGNVDTRTVDRHIASLRKKLEADRTNPRYIITEYARGYRFEP